MTRTRWALGRLAFLNGAPGEAVPHLRQCIAEFDGLGMLTESGLVAIDLAEILDATGRTHEVVRLLAGIVARFTEAGKLTSALTAFTYLKEAAASAALTKPLLTYARRFVVRADRQPDLLFAPPPRDQRSV